MVPGRAGVMIRKFLFALLLLLAFVPPAAAQNAGLVRVKLETAEGNILLDVDTKRAPITANNFLRYVDEKKLDGTYFYRTAKTKGVEGRGFIQGGIRHNIRRSLPPIAHEPTSKTGIKHVSGTISMARTTPGSAMGDFFIILNDMPSMDADPKRPGDNVGYAAFGKVASGMDTVRRILNAPTVKGAGSGSMKDQFIAEPIRIVKASRVK